MLGFAALLFLLFCMPLLAIFAAIGLPAGVAAVLAALLAGLLLGGAALLLDERLPTLASVAGTAAEGAFVLTGVGVVAIVGIGYHRLGLTPGFSALAALGSLAFLLIVVTLAGKRGGPDRRRLSEQLAWERVHDGELHPTTLLTTQKLIHALRRAGEGNEAIALTEETLARVLHTRGPDDEDALRFAALLVTLKADSPAYREVRALAEDVLPRLRRVRGEDDRMTLQVARWLGFIMIRMGEPADALRLLTDVHDRLCRAQGPRAEETRATRALLDQLQAQPGPQ
ncbi:hypothetical protein [Parafrankia sp. FMc2]|uniref:hypothetical protein n=1 Tax=Parafrankia sp. FMc2 TaxID=3233196 RepID=UPI0034D58341